MCPVGKGSWQKVQYFVKIQPFAVEFFYLKWQKIQITLKFGTEHHVCFCIPFLIPPLVSMLFPIAL